jgi:plasmid stabilization system protein ParE
MALKIKWNARAENSFSRIVEYLELSYGQRTTQEFVQKLFQS